MICWTHTACRWWSWCLCPELLEKTLERVPSPSEKFQHQRGADGTVIYGGGMREPLAHLKPFLKPPHPDFSFGLFQSPPGDWLV